MLKVQVKGKERSGPWWQFSVLVHTVFRTGSSHVKRGLQALWVPDRDLTCGCPALQVGRSFLLIGAEESGRSWVPEEKRLVADRTTMALQWREHWGPKLRGFRGQDTRGKCPQGNTTAQKHSDPNYEEYTPPHLEKLEKVYLRHKHIHTTTHKHKTLHGKGLNTTRHVEQEEDRKAENDSRNGKYSTSTSPSDTENILQNTPDPLLGTTKVSHGNERDQYHPTVCPTWSPE